MKTTLIKLLALSGIAIMLMPACKKNDLQVTSNGGQGGTLSSSAGTTLVLNKAKVADTTKVITFSFTNANYGYNAAITNTLQIDVASDNWKKPTSFTLNAKQLSQGFSTYDFDNLLLKLNLPGGVASQVQVRVAQAVSSTVTTYTNVLTMTVTPFNLTSFLYVPGAYQGWNPATADSLISATSNGIYSGIVNFTAGNLDFKITPAKVWTHSYGSTNNSTIVYDGGNNITAPGAGQYIVTVNTNTNTITFQAANFFSIIGDGAIDWGTDVPMKYVNDGNGNWVVTTALKSSGAFKVRRNNDWTWSWGIPKANTEGAGVPNTLNDSSNDNITVSANGTYKVTFYSPASASGGTPAVTTTYSAVKIN